MFTRKILPIFVLLFVSSLISTTSNAAPDCWVRRGHLTAADVSEIQALYPGEKVKVGDDYDWCKPDTECKTKHNISNKNPVTYPSDSWVVIDAPPIRKGCSICKWALWYEIPGIYQCECQ